MTLFGDQVAAFFTEQILVTILLGTVGFLFWWVLRKGFNRNVLFWAVPVVVAVPAAQRHRHRRRVSSVCGSIPSESSTGGSRSGKAIGPWPSRSGRGPTGSAWRSCAWCCCRKLSLGLSGFEMSMILMPQVRGRKDDEADHPRGRIRNTRKVLPAAAVIMSVICWARCW